MTWTTFVAAYTTTAVAKGVKADIRRRALARYTERLQGESADSVLDFSDLVRELTDAEAA